METQPKSKCCRKCGEDKPVEDFYDNKMNKDGLHSYCKPCHKETGAARRQKKPLGHLLAARKWRAKQEGIPFTITAKDIECPTHCPVLGVPLQHSQGHGSGCYDDSPSLDRIVPELGYVPGNVAVISGLANRIKSNATTEQVEAVAAWMRTVGAK